MGSKTETKTNRVKIKQAHITEAAKKAEAGMPPGMMDIYADDAVSGLQLRVQAKRAFWVLKYGKITKAIGFVHVPKDMTREVPSISEARELATACKKVVDSQPDLLDPVLNRYFEEPVGSRNFEEARSSIRRKPTTWTFRQCFEHVIEVRLTPDKEGKVKDVYEFTLTMKREVMQPLLDMPAVSLQRGDFDDVRKVISDEFGISAANKAISNCKVVLDYCMRKASKHSGLSHLDPWWKLIEGAGKVAKRNRAPSVDDIVKIMVAAEEFLEKPLPGRIEEDGKAGVRANVFAAAWWLVLTVQRTYAALHLPRTNFFPDKEAPTLDWYLASWPEDVMKVVEFALPIPPRAVEHMLPLIEAAKAETKGESQWAFPSGRKPKKGSDKTDITVSESGVRQMLQRLRARDPQSKDKDGNLREGVVDFFAKLGVPWWTPHDLRRSIGKVLDKSGIPGGSSAVLAHKIKMPERPMNDREREEWLAQHVEDITRAAYHDPAHMHLKAKAMLVWTDTILDRYEQISPRAQVRKAERDRILAARYIYRDAVDVESTIEPARIYAAQRIADQRAIVDKRERAVQSIIAEEPVNLSAVAFAKEMLADAHYQMDKLSTDALIKGSEQARGSRDVLGINRKDHFDFDYRKKTPAWIAIRNDFVLGRITIQQLKDRVADEFGTDFSLSSAGIFLPGRGPTARWKGTVSEKEEIAMRKAEQQEMGLLRSDG